MVRRFFSVLAVLVATVVCASAQVVVFTWSSGAETGNFNTAANWIGSTVPTFDAEHPAHLQFGDWSTGTPTVNLDVSFTATSLTFNAPYTEYQLGSSNASVLSLGAGGLTVSQSPVTFASSLPIILTAIQPWTLDSNVTVASTMTGPGGITQSGSAYLTLSGLNTFSGGVSLSGGALILAASSTANMSGNVVTSVISGPLGTGTLTIANCAELRVSDNQTLHNAIVITAERLTAYLDYDSLILAGVITGTGNLTKTGYGDLTLSGANTFSGGVSLNDGGVLYINTSSLATVVSGVVTSVTSGPLGTGTLELSNSATLTNSGTTTTLHNAIHLFTEGGGYLDTGAGSLTLAGVITGAGGFNKLGSGTLTLTGDNTFGGPLEVREGTLLLGRSGVAGFDSEWTITSSPVGRGHLILGSTDPTTTHTTLAPVPGSGQITLYNPVILKTDTFIGQAGSSDQLRFDTKPGLSSGLRGNSSEITVTVKGGVLVLAATPGGDMLDTANLNNIAVDGGGAVVFAFRTALPTTGVSGAAGSYVGVSDGVLSGNPMGFHVASGYDPSLLLAKLTPASFAGTFGLDSETPASPASFAGSLDFSNFSHGDFGGIGTLSSAILTSSATLFAPTSTGRLTFSALNSGILQIDTALLSAHNLTNVVIGRDDGRADRGTVILTSSSNNYTGGTNLKSGTLAVGDATALGTGPLTASNATTAPVTSADAPKLTTTVGTRAPLNLTLPNNLVVDTSYASGAFGLGLGGTDNFTLSGTVTGSGVIDKYGASNVTLSGNGAGFTGHINILGGTLTIGAGGTTGAISADVTNNAALAFNRSDALTYGGSISGSGTLTKLGAGTLTLTNTNSFVGGTTISSGTLAIGSGGTGGLIIGNVTNNATLAVNRSDAVSFGGIISGTGNLLKQGAGTLTLTGTNTYSGTTRIAGGTVSISSAANLGSSDVVFEGGTLRTTGAANLTLNNFFNLGGDGTVRNDLTGGSVLTLASNISLNGYVITFTGAGATQAASINQAADLVVDGGNLTLTNTEGNSYDGPTFVRNGGTLATGAANTMPTSPRTALILDDTGTGASTFALGGFSNSLASLAGASSSLVTLGTGTLTIGTATGTNTFAGTISGTGGSLVKDGLSTQILSGANTYTGTTTISAGSLVIGAGGTSGSLAGNIVNNATLIFNRSDASTYAGVISGSGTLAKQGAGTLSLTGASTFTGGTTVTGGTLAIGAGGTTGSLAGNIVNNATLAFNRSDATTYSGVISGTGAVAQQGSGVLTLSGVNTYTGGTVFTAGTLLVGADSALGQASGGLTFGGGALKVSTGLTSARAITLSSGGGTINTNTYGVTLSGVISGTGGLTHQGTGILTLSGTNTYTGGTTVQGGGVLDFTSNLNLGAAAGGVTLNGGYLRTQAAIGDFTHPIVLGASGGNLNTNGLDSTFSGQITGSGSLVVQSQTGNGKLTLSNPGNNYTGATFVDSGILEISVINALPVTTALTLSNSANLDVDANQTVASLASSSTSTSVDIDSGKTFKVDGTASTSFAGVIEGAGSFAKSGSGTLSLTNTNTFTGGTTVSGGILSIGDGGTTGTVPGNIVDNATVAFNRSNALTYTGVISGTGGLLKQSAGLLTLSSANTYAGTTVITGGTLRIGTVNALPATTQLTIGPGATLDVLNHQTIAGFLGAGDATSTLQLSGGTTFTVAMPLANATTTFAGNVTGAGIFAVSGAGNDVVNLTGAVSNTGGTQIGTGATLVIGTGGSISGPITTTGTLTFGNSGPPQTFSNVISGTGGISATSGTTTLSAPKLYTGPTNITGGKLLVTNVTGSGTGTGTVTVGSGGIFGGTGTISGPLVLNSGGIVSPGASPGTLSVGPTTFAGGAHFAFEINNAGGTAGTHWDLLSISGLLSITATSGSPFIIDITSLDSGNNPGLTANFTSSGTYSWLFASASGG
ncbi:MAG: autotransporter-associated beta strand repeat-containing protein, partial [Verrucomicrobia bacterium]|nr:autotransporter-associated beta strand repeat-containing protein [Verrucomicrobiota bacterium]